MSSRPWTVVASHLPPLPQCRASSCAAALLLVVTLSACAGAPVDPEQRAAFEQANDPAEPTNRTIFAGNQWVDRNALQPVARAYDEYVPGGVRRGVRNFSRNLQEPGILVNDALQGNFSRAWNTTQRFAVNTTVGAVGIFDVASDLDLPAHEADFGQTFGVWGIGPGPSVQLPLLGHSNVRDTAGRVVGFMANPLGFVPGDAVQAVQTVSTGLGMVSQRADALPATDALERSSLDYYATLRSISAQRRQALIAEGKAGRPRGRIEIIQPVASTAPAASSP